MAKTSHFDVQDAGLFKTSEYCLFAYNAYTKIKNQSVTDDSSIVTALAVYLLDIQRVRHFKIQLTNLQVNDVPEKFQKVVSLFHKAVQLGFAISRDTAQAHKSSLNPAINHFLSQFNNFGDLIKGNTSANNEVLLEAPRVPKPDISTVSIAGTWNRPTQPLEKNTNTTKKLM